MGTWPELAAGFARLRRYFVGRAVKFAGLTLVCLCMLIFAPHTPATAVFYLMAPFCTVMCVASVRDAQICGQHRYDCLSWAEVGAILG